MVTQTISKSASQPSEQGQRDNKYIKLRIEKMINHPFKKKKNFFHVQEMPNIIYKRTPKTSEDITKA